MNVEEVKRRLEVIRKLALDEKDNEVAHAEEDKLWEDTLLAISDGVKNPIELATLALTSRNVVYQRWYS